MNETSAPQADARPKPEPGRVVTIAEAAVFADPRCKGCYGSGRVTKIVGKRTVEYGEPNAGAREDVKRLESCACAIRGIRKACGSFLVEVDTSETDEATGKGITRTTLHWPAASALSELVPVHAPDVDDVPWCQSEKPIAAGVKASTLTCPECVAKLAA
jgi:hypothetical protein